MLVCMCNWQKKYREADDLAGELEKAGSKYAVADPMLYKVNLSIFFFF